MRLFKISGGLCGIYQFYSVFFCGSLLLCFHFDKNVLMCVFLVSVIIYPFDL